MSVSLDRFRAKLVIKILYARSVAETERFIRTAISAMEKGKVNAQVITRFVDCVINQLNVFQPSNRPPLQWDNIEAATRSLLQIRRSIDFAL
ncbi:MAG: hypothetical protein ABI813_02205 [Bacteroidota bacterium]